MTQVAFSQRALVAASLQVAPTSAERHGTYGIRPAVRPCPNPRCVDGEVMFRYNWLDPQTEDSEACLVCAGVGTIPVPRRVADSRRVA